MAKHYSTRDFFRNPGCLPAGQFRRVTGQRPGPGASGPSGNRGNPGPGSLCAGLARQVGKSGPKISPAHSGWAGIRPDPPGCRSIGPPRSRPSYTPESPAHGCQSVPMSQRVGWGFQEPSIPLVVVQTPRSDLFTISKLPGDAVTRMSSRHYAHLCHHTKRPSLGHQAEPKRKPDESWTPSIPPRYSPWNVPCARWASGWKSSWCNRISSNCFQGAPRG